VRFTWVPHRLGGLRIGYRADVVFGKPLVLPRPSWPAKPLELREGTLTRQSPALVGRVYPKPPRCSPVGDANKVRTS
jgi:hypothetical protein